MEQFQQNFPDVFDLMAQVLQREIELDACITIQRFFRKYRNQNPTIDRVDPMPTANDRVSNAEAEAASVTAIPDICNLFVNLGF